MKTTGLIRTIDEVGRIIIPIKIRKKFKFNENKELEILCNDEFITIRKFDCDRHNVGKIGKIRTVDRLGRVTIPVEMREDLAIFEKTSLEIFIEGELIILKKHQASCLFCGMVRDIKRYKNKWICTKCIKHIKGDVKNEK